MVTGFTKASTTVHKMLHRAKIAWAFSLEEKVWFVLLFCLSGCIRFLLFTLPFRWISLFLGKQANNSSYHFNVSDWEFSKAVAIGRMVAIVSRYTPWESKCLVQAIMARSLFFAYGIPYVIYLGAMLSGSEVEPLKAHAWVSVGGRIVTGRQGHSAFTVVCAFADPRIL